MSYNIPPSNIDEFYKLYPWISKFYLSDSNEIILSVVTKVYELTPEQRSEISQLTKTRQQLEKKFLNIMGIITLWGWPLLFLMDLSLLCSILPVIPSLYHDPKLDTTQEKIKDYSEKYWVEFYHYRLLVDSIRSKIDDTLAPQNKI